MRQFSLSTTRREELVDITAEVAGILQDIVRETGLAEGAVLIYSPHTTAGITINEGADPDVRRDILAHLAQLVPARASFRHAEGNSDAHIKTSLMGPMQLVPVSGGKLQLGTWQKVYFCEFDGPRSRSVLVQCLPSVPAPGTAGEGA